MKKIFLIPGLLFLLLISGCATPLAGIKNNPAKYAGADTMIRAEVELEAPIPFMDYSLYRINDQTDKMFLFTNKKYMIGDKIFTGVHVIGITEKSTARAAEEAASETANFLVKHRIADVSEARKLSKKIIGLISTLGSLTEGSYFLISE